MRKRTNGNNAGSNRGAWRAMAAGSLLALTGLATGAAGPGEADDQATGSKQEIRGSFETPMTPQTPHDAIGGDDRQRHEPRSHARVIVKNDDGAVLDVVIRDGKLSSATIDGEPVSEDRIELEDKEIRILDREGSELFRVRRAGTSTRILGDDGRELGRVVVEPERRVIIGITMSEPDEVVLEHLGIEPGTAVKIDKVYEGLPAHEAGLKPNDIIVRIEDEDKIEMENLGEIINRFDPGDAIEVEVIRRGERREFEVELGKYERGIFRGSDDKDADEWHHRSERADRLEEVEEMIRKLREKAKHHGGRVELREEEIEELARKLERSIGKDADRPFAWSLGESGNIRGRIEFDDGDKKRFFMVGPDGRSGPRHEGMRMWMAPPPPGKPGEGVRMQPFTRMGPAWPGGEELLERLEHLEKRLDRIEDLLERIADDS